MILQPYIFILIFFSIFILVEAYYLIKYLRQSLPPIKRIQITFRINLVIFSTGLLMIAIVILFDINYLKYKAPIPHQNWRQITFDDFKGLKRPNETLDGGNEFAFIVTELVLVESNNKIGVVCYFHPSRSYVFKDNLYNNELLKHEIYHFHIAEYCSRLLRKQIAKIKTASRYKAENLKANILRIEDSLQVKYDYETYHSYVMGKQLEWQLKIDSCLNSLKEYENN